MSRAAKLELHKDEFSFSAGHFTIFSATEREDLHGHNYNVSLEMQIKVNDNGLAFDYRIYKNKILEICKQLDRKFLLPDRSKFMRLEDAGDMWLGHFNGERIPLLKRDAVILPLCNITIEELSHWFLQQLLQDMDAMAKQCIDTMTLRVFNGPGQSGGALWENKN